MLPRHARKRIGALSRARHLLSSANLKTMYLMFIRSIMEYNSILWMGAAQSHRYLNTLDRVQHTAEKICNFTAEPLQARRDAAALAFAFKLLDGKTRGELAHFVVCTKTRRTSQTLQKTNSPTPRRHPSRLQIETEFTRCASEEFRVRPPQNVVSNPN